MKITYRGTLPRLRGGFSFGVSGCVHGCVLTWVVLAGGGPPQPRAQSIYDQEIRGHEKQIVWYSLREKLPEIAPADPKPDGRPARARVKAAQTMVAGARDDATAATLIWAPEPEVTAPKAMPLPNVVAAAPKVVRPFVAPVEKRAAASVAALADAPEVKEKRSLAVADLGAPVVARGPVRGFVAPEKKRMAASVAAFADAPEVAEKRLVTVADLGAPVVTRGPVKGFVAPVEKRTAASVAALADAPEVAEKRLVTLADLGAPVVTRGPVRGFVAPAEKRKAAGVAAFADAPEVAEKRLVTVADLGAPVVTRGPVRGFVAPAEKRQAAKVAALADAPEVKEHRSLTVAAPIGTRGVAAGAPAISAEPPLVVGPGAVAAASMAIVGLNPARTIDVPPPPGSRTAGFSAGEQPRADGGTGANSIALLNVPGLVVKGGAKDTQPTLATSFSPTSRENLLAAARVTMGAAAKVAGGTRLSGVVAPDPRFAGRTVYTIAIQMPNVTSFSGSWLVWFAEREPVAGAAAPQIRAPVVVRKVDPKYIAAAAAERVEGTVRLFAVIGKDGHVDGIALLRQLDDRLDHSAQEALAKWEFGPALRDGVPVDVDAIFEIPFHLAPRPNQ